MTSAYQNAKGKCLLLPKLHALILMLSVNKDCLFDNERHVFCHFSLMTQSESEKSDVLVRNTTPLCASFLESISNIIG